MLILSLSVIFLVEELNQETRKAGGREDIEVTVSKMGGFALMIIQTNPGDQVGNSSPVFALFFCRRDFCIAH